MEKILAWFCFSFTSFFLYYFNFLRKWRAAVKVDDESDERLSTREVKMGMQILAGFCFSFSSFLFYYFNFLGKWRAAEKVDDEPDERLSTREVKMVMERLGIGYDSDTEELEERVGVEDFCRVLEGKPSLEEMKKVFEVWDENGDGFIDAGELESVFCKLGMDVGSEPQVYTRMIGAVDDNGDGVVDFDEFLKLMDQC